MLVNISPERLAFIERLVREGEYRDIEEVVNAAVMQMAEHDQRVTELKAALQIGIDQLYRGEGIPFTPKLIEEIWEEIERRNEVGLRPKSDVLP